MARRPQIERQELFEAADQIAEQGKPVTALTVLDAMGGGSLRTIYKFLAEWESLRSETTQATNTGEVPDSVKNSFAAAWRTATLEAAKEVTSAKEKAAEEVKAAHKKFDDVLEVVQKLEADTERDTLQIEELKAALATSEQSVATLNRENAAAKATADQLIFQVKSLEAELERLHKDIEQDRSAHRTQIEKLNSEYANSQQKSAEQIERLHQEKELISTKAGQLERDLQSARLKLEQSEKQAELADANRVQSSKERDEITQQAAEQRGQIESLKFQNQQLLAALQSQEKPNAGSSFP